LGQVRDIAHQLAIAARHALHWLPANRPPWHDTGMDLEPGESVTLLADGRIHLSRAFDLTASSSVATAAASMRASG
jgi:hypothetical protein